MILSITIYSQSSTNKETDSIQKCFNTVQIDSLYSKLYDGQLCKKELVLVYQLNGGLKAVLSLEKERIVNLEQQIKNLNSVLEAEKKTSNLINMEKEIFSSMLHDQKKKTKSAYFIGVGAGVVGTLTYFLIKSITN